jgi:hypothetical protein
MSGPLKGVSWSVTSSGHGVRYQDYYPGGSRSPSLKGNQGPKQLEGLGGGETRGRSPEAGGDSEKRAEDPRPLVDCVLTRVL